MGLPKINWLLVGGAFFAVYLFLNRSKYKPVRFAPGSPEQITLFEQAARLIGVSADWASSQGLIKILKHESDGWVGRPNYTYGDRAKNKNLWAVVVAELQAGVTSTRSSASGLGMLLLSNVEKYYPNGRKGVGVPLDEAAGMLSYIKSRYGTPDAAWARASAKAASLGKEYAGY